MPVVYSLGMKNPIKEAVRIVGGQAELARLLDVTPQAVNKWVSHNRPPVLRAADIERVTQGKVTRHDLNPDVFTAPE